MLGSCLLFLQNVSECITAMEELEFDVVCMLWHTDDLILDLDARLVTGAWQLGRPVGKMLTHLSYLQPIAHATATQQQQHASNHNSNTKKNDNKKTK